MSDRITGLPEEDYPRNQGADEMRHKENTGHSADGFREDCIDSVHDEVLGEETPDLHDRCTQAGTCTTDCTNAKKRRNKPVYRRSGTRPRNGFACDGSICANPSEEAIEGAEAISDYLGRMPPHRRSIMVEDI